MSEDTIRKVVRAMGSGRIHVADVHPDQLFPGRWLGPPCLWVESPLATGCGRVLRDEAVCMKDGTKVSCPQCRRLTGVEVAADGNDGARVEPLVSLRAEYEQARAERAASPAGSN